MTAEEVIRETNRLACRLVRERGLAPKEACRLATRAAFRTLGTSQDVGLGQETTTATSSPDLLQRIRTAGESKYVTEVRGAVSPWLWVVSVASAIKGFFGKK